MKTTHTDPHPRRQGQDRPPRRRAPRRPRQSPTGWPPDPASSASTGTTRARGRRRSPASTRRTWLRRSVRRDWLRPASSSSRQRPKVFAGWCCCPAAASAARAATSRSTRGHVELENAVKDSGVDWTIIRPAWFAQGFSEDFLLDYVLAGEIRLSAGTGAEAWIDTGRRRRGDDGRAARRAAHRRDLLAVRAAPAHHARGRRRTVSTATGRPIRYVDLEPEEHVAELVGYGLPQEDAEAVRDLFAVIRNHRSEYVSDGVQQVLGRAPRDFTDWARETAKTGVWSV